MDRCSSMQGDLHLNGEIEIVEKQSRNSRGTYHLCG